jgi:hypothetical protein
VVISYVEYWLELSANLRLDEKQKKQVLKLNEWFQNEKRTNHEIAKERILIEQLNERRNKRND